MFDRRSPQTQPDLPEPAFFAELDSASTALADLAQWDTSMFSGEELCLAVTQIEQTRRFVDAASVQVLAELDSRGFTDSEHGMRTGAWLARESATSNLGAKSRVRTANKLRIHFPKVAEALRDGLISYEHAAAITGVANPRITNQLDFFPTLSSPLKTLPSQPLPQTRPPPDPLPLSMGRTS